MESQYYSKDLKNILNSDSKTMTEGSKGSHSKSHSKKELSPSTMISSIEREILELIQETTIRAQKSKLISIQETLKILSKKLSYHTNSDSLSYNQKVAKENSETEYKKDSNSISVIQTSNQSNSNVIDIIKSKQESEALNKIYEKEIKELNEKLKNTDIEKYLGKDVAVNKTLIPSTNDSASGFKKEEIFAKLNLRIDQLTNYIQEEKNKNNLYVIQIKELEESLKSLNSEYISVNSKYFKIQNENEFLEKTINDMKKNTNENKNKFEDLIKINSGLKAKFMESENTLKLHNEDLKSLLKKNSINLRVIEELENKNKFFNSELCYKDERLKALRLMNNKLEQKSKLILKKFENIKYFEERTNEVNSNNQRMLEVIEELNTKYKNELCESERLIKTSEELNKENFNLKNETEEIRKQLILMKNINDDLNSKNAELEKKFKVFLESKDNLNTSITNKKGMGNINMSVGNSTYRSMNNQQKINNLNEIHLEDLKPSKIVITQNNNVEVLHK